MKSVCLYPVSTYEDGRGKFKLVLVDDQEYGYRNTKYGTFDTEEEAWEKADELNMDMGLYKREWVAEIVQRNMDLKED